jgi:hypothetical protein
MGRKYLGTKQVNVQMLPTEEIKAKVRNFASEISLAEINKEPKEKKYKVLVWFRFVSAGEIEKDFEIHYTSALSQEDAKRKVTIEHYSGHSAIPFKYEVNEIREQIDEQIAQEI